MNRLRTSLLAAAIATVAALAVFSPASADLTTPHASLVPELPRVGAPEILNGDVLAIEQIGNWVIAGGDFTQVRLADGTVIDRAYIVAWDVDTLEFIDTFQPAVDGAVLAVAEGPTPGDIFIGGQFNTVNDRGRRKLAKVFTDGSVDTTWRSQASARVTNIEFTDTGRMFVGGSFKRIDNQDIEHIAELVPASGDALPYLDVEFDGEGGARSGGQNIKHLEALPGGNQLLVVHSAETIDGLPRKAAAMFDISVQTAPFMTDYSIHNWFNDAPFGALPTNGDLSPDGTFFAISTNIGDRPPWHDSVILFPTSGGPDTQPIWSHRMRDSVFSVAVSNNAVYAGGHFCRIDEGPGATVVEGRDDKVCTGAFRPTGAWRWQVAALNIADGTPLDWDPGSNSRVGVQELTVTDRGLLLGHDGSQVNNRSVGRAAFFDFGAAALDQQDPTLTVDQPLPGQLVESPLEISGTVNDDLRVMSVKVRIQDNVGGQWLQADGSLGAAAHDFVVPFDHRAGIAEAWSVSAIAPDGAYRIESRAIDSAGNVTTNQFSISVGEEPPPVCTATVDGNDVILNWTLLEGEDRYAVRRDGPWLTTLTGGATTFTDVDVSPGNHSYVIRSKEDGITTDQDCGTITIDPPADPVCTLEVNGTDVMVFWTALDGENSYSVRRDGSWIATVSGGATAYVDTTATPGPHTYVVRSIKGGVVTDQDCGGINL